MSDSDHRALDLTADSFRVAFDSAPIGVALVAPDGRYLKVNDALCRMLGYGCEELLALSFADVTHPDDLAATLARKDKQLRGEPGQTRIEKRYLRSGGETIWVAVSSTMVGDANRVPLYSVAQIEDITDRKRIEEEFRYLADHDQLTGLLNRRRLNEELGRALLDITQDPDRRAALLLLDIDEFKLVNDTLGHAAGDDVLRAVAQAVRSSVRTSDTVGRLGGDEFAVVLHDIANSEEAHAVASAVADAFRSRRLLTSEGEAKITVSIGVVPLDHSVIGEADPLIAADGAMYAAKRNGRNRIEIAA